MILGIDLGTTNSLISYLNNNIAAAIPNAHGQFLTPSVVSIDEDDTVIVGAVARERLFTHPKTTVGSFKRLMGTQQTVSLGKKTFTPEELSALVLRTLKADAETHLGESVQEVIISVPAYFNDAQRKSTRLAGELAGLKVIRLINEPTAAALFHGIQDHEGEAKFLIFDLGGGTFDVSILEKFEGIMEVRATGGDSFLGGDDFTQILVDLFMKKRVTGINAKPLSVNHQAALRFACDNAKRRLSEAQATDIELNVNGEILKINITLDEFETACKPLMERLRTPIERALRDARLKTADLDEVVLVGGSTRLPLVRKLVAQLFGRLPARYIDPDQTIALGAAVCAGLSEQNVAFEEVVLTDVCPHSLGTEVSDYNERNEYLGTSFMPIIERNTVVPASRVKTVVTAQDGQKVLKITVYQGESRDCKNNTLLETLEINVPAKPKGEVSANIRYTYDINGILEVDIDIDKTGLSKNLIIKKLAGNISEEDIAKRRAMLAGLKIHPRDTEENRLAMARADRLYEQYLGEEREQVSRLIGQFKAALESQDNNTIAKARAAFSHALDSMERGDTFW